MARQKGASTEVLDALQDRRDRTPLAGLEPAWQVALEYADAVHRSGHDVSDELYTRLRQGWDDGQIVELTLVIGMTEYFNRFNDSLRVEPTK